MKISDFRWTKVAVPTRAPRRSADGMSGIDAVRTIVEIETDNGLIGLGEIGPRVSNDRLNGLKSTLVGQDPYRIEHLRRVIAASRFYSMELSIVMSGIEMACLDIQGQAAGRPLADLLGGRLRDTIPSIAYIYRLGESPDAPEVRTTDQVVRHIQDLVDEFGFETIKLKGGAEPPNEDIDLTRATRAAFPNHRIRLDPNGVWTVATSLRVANTLLDQDLEWLEDPTMGLDGMAEVTKRSPIPTATNMCLVDFHEFSSAVQKRAVDIMLLDIFFLAGVRQAREMAAACSMFGIDIGIHSGGSGGPELGISLSAMVHLASTLPNLCCAIDTMYHHWRDDVIQGGLLPITGGALAVSDAPGLGVTLDRDKVRLYAERFERSRRSGGSRDPDPRRPGWLPAYPAW